MKQQPWIVLAFLLLAVPGMLLAMRYPTQALFAAAYVVSAFVGHLIVRSFGPRIILGPLLLLVVVAPRVVQVENTGGHASITDAFFGVPTGVVIALSSFSAVGGALALRLSSHERRLALVPLVLMVPAGLLSSSMLLDPAFGWMAAMGAMIVLARHWGPSLFSSPLLALALGVASIVWVIPGLGADIATLQSGIRVFGVFGNPLIAAIAINFLIVLVLVLAWPRMLWVLLLFAVGAWMSISTGSRTGLVMIVVLLGATVWGFFPVKALQTRQWGRRMVMAVAAGAGIYAFVEYRNVLGRAAGLEESEGSVVARSAGLQQGFYEMLSHPFGGSTVAVEYATGVNRTFENMFFDIGARMGWFPLMAVVVAIVLGFFLCAAPGRVVVLLLVMVSFTTSPYYFPAAFIIPLIAIGLAGRSAQVAPSFSNDQESARVI